MADEKNGAPARREGDPPLDGRVIAQLYRAFELLGAQSDLLGVVGSWRDTYSDEELVGELKAWNADKFAEIEKYTNFLREVQEQRDAYEKARKVTTLKPGMILGKECNGGTWTVTTIVPPPDDGDAPHIVEGK